MNPEELAIELGISAKHLRAWLRREYPRPAAMVHKRWALSQAQERAARTRFASRGLRAESREGMRMLSIALPESVVKRFERVAAQEHVSVTGLVREAAIEWLERNGRRKA